MSLKNTFDPVREKIFLDSLVNDYKDQSPYSKIKKDIIIEAIEPYLINRPQTTALQLGCANGYETEQLVSRTGSLVIVDGANSFIEKLNNSNTNTSVRFIYTLFEEFSFDTYGQKFDYIFCNYVLEHVYDPNIILVNLKMLLKPGGLLFIVVPNYNALSRRIALKMRLINDLTVLTENDHKHGHRRVYDKASIINEVVNAGLDLKAVKGIIFKILADFQLNQLLSSGFFTEHHIQALQKLAEEPDNIDFSDSILLVASL